MHASDMELPKCSASSQTLLSEERHDLNHLHTLEVNSTILKMGTIWFSVNFW